MIFTPDATRSWAACCAAVAGTASTPTMMFFSRIVSASVTYSLTVTFPTGAPSFSGSVSNTAAMLMPCSAKIGEPIGNVTVSNYSQLAEACREKNIIAGVLAVPATAAQDAANDLVGSGVKIIFNYSEALVETPADVTVHTSNPAVELLYALYFHLT